MEPIRFSYSAERDAASRPADEVDAITDDALRDWLGDVVSDDKLLLSGEAFRGLELSVSQVSALLQAAFELSGHRKVAKCKIFQVHDISFHRLLYEAAVRWLLLFVYLSSAQCRYSLLISMQLPAANSMWPIARIQWYLHFNACIIACICAIADHDHNVLNCLYACHPQLHSHVSTTAAVVCIVYIDCNLCNTYALHHIASRMYSAARVLTFLLWPAALCLTPYHVQSV